MGGLVAIILAIVAFGANSLIEPGPVNSGPAAASEYGPYGAPYGTIPAEPPEFVGRPRLPLCGAESPAGEMVERDLAARRCLLHSWRDGIAVEFVTTNSSVEGPFLVIYRVIGDGTVEELSNDSPWGQGPLRKVCKELEVSLDPPPDPSDPFRPTGIRVRDCERTELWD